MHGRLLDEKGQAGSGKGPPLARIVGNGLAFLSLHVFVYKMGRITYLLWVWEAALRLGVLSPLPLSQSPADWMSSSISGHARLRPLWSGEPKWAAHMSWGWGLLGAMAASSAVRATLQGTGTQLRETRAKKEQLAARVQEVQAMLAMDTGGLRLLPAPALIACPPR